MILLAPPEIGKLAEAGEVLPLPLDFTADTSSYLWSGLAANYQTTLPRWGTRLVAVPLIAEGYVFLYRDDVLGNSETAKAFRTQFARDPLPIRSWEDLAEVGEFVTAKSGKPSLQRLPKSDAAAFVAFAQIAACYDRAPYGGSNKPVDGVDLYRRGQSFLVENETGFPRLRSPAFLEAFRWFVKTAPARKTDDDGSDDLVSGTVVAGLYPLAALKSLPQTETGVVESRFGLSGMLGTRKYFDQNSAVQNVATPNVIPYLGGGGVMGVVRKTASHPEVCWALLSELGGPAGSEAMLSIPEIGAGPIRTSQLSDDLKLWRGYRFDEERTRELGRGLVQYQATGTINPCMALRTPDQTDITALIVKVLRKAAAGAITAEDAQKQALEAWDAHDAKVPESDRKAWRRRSAGME